MHPGAAAELPLLWNEACTYYAAALAKNTVKQYTFHVRTFALFCVSSGFDFERPSEYHVMMYVALLARNLASATVRQYLKGLKDYYKRRAFAKFTDPIEWPSLNANLKGVDRLKKKDVGKKCPITPAMLLKFSHTVPRSPVGTALWACVLITFFGYFRKSNTTSEGVSPLAVSKCLRVCDIEDVPLK